MAAAGERVRGRHRRLLDAHPNLANLPPVLGADDGHGMEGFFTYKGEELYGFADRLPVIGWTVLVSVPADDVNATERRLLLIYLVGIVVFLVPHGSCTDLR